MRGQAIKFLYASLIVGGVYFFTFLATPILHAQDVEIGGWAWNSLLGWISQRDIISDLDAKERKGTFGVVKYDEGKGKPDVIEGWSWSSSYGFMCWGRTCKTLCTREQEEKNQCLSSDEAQDLAGSPDPPDGSREPIAKITKTVEEVETVIKGKLQNKKLFVVKGWAKLITLQEGGWVSLSGCTEEVEPDKKCPSDKDYGIFYDPDTQEFRGWAWNSTVGWIAFSGKTLYDTPYSFVEKGDERYEVKDGRANTPDGSRLVDDLIAEGFRFIDKDKGRACLTPGLCEDIGFSEKLGKSPWRTQYVGPWIQTRGANTRDPDLGTTLFSREGFDARTSPGFVAEQVFTGEYDEIGSDGTKTGKKLRGSIGIATGCDVSDRKCKSIGKKRAANELIENSDLRAGALLLEFPKQSKKDKNKLVSRFGSLQKKAFTTVSVPGKKNGYGYHVKSIDGEAALNSVWTAGLQNTIYLYDASGESGSAVLPTTLFFGSEIARNHIQLNNGTRSGAGTIVAYGADIKIYRPFIYEKGTVDDLKKLASVAWIALKDESGRGGNIIFDDCIPPMLHVDNSDIAEKDKLRLTSVPLAGLFFAEGKIQTGIGDGKECIKSIRALVDQEALSAGLGKILTKAFQGDFSELDAPLTIEGIAAAAKFDLQRVYGGFDQGSELILDTGRARVNPPPGIEDIIRSLPVK